MSGVHIGGAIQTHAAPAAAILCAIVATARAWTAGNGMSNSLAPSVTRTSAGRRASHWSRAGSLAQVVVYVALVASTT